MFKLRLIDKYRQLILDALEDNPDEEQLEKILESLSVMNKRREEIAKMLKMVTL